MSLFWVHALGLSLLCSENCLLYFLALLQFFAYYVRVYATPQSIMLVVMQFNNYTIYKNLPKI